MGKPVLLLLPGLLCDREVWLDQRDELEDVADCRIADYGAADSLAAMAQVVLREAPPSFALAGHSMGGRVALEILRTASQRVERLALLDTGYQARAEGAAGDHEAEQRLTLLELARNEGMRAMGKVWLQGMIHPARLHDATLVSRILAMIERKTPELFAAQIRALLARPDATGLLAGIACPTVILCGREDAWSPLARHEQMAAAIAGARLAVIEQCGHMSTMERPSEIASSLRDWLATDN